MGFNSGFKGLNIKFRNNPSSENWVVPCGGTDWYDKANRRFSQFCESS